MGLALDAALTFGFMRLFVVFLGCTFFFGLTAALFAGFLAFVDNFIFNIFLDTVPLDPVFFFTKDLFAAFDFFALLAFGLATLPVLALTTFF